ncbi:MAG TPA: hypothetical protein VHS58_16065 [Acetobacteraceae bacterium]|nr:hypothetical protein [Acetobacteraceae bacterium]
MEGADASAARLDRVRAGRDITVSTVQVFVGPLGNDDRVVSVASDGGISVESVHGRQAVAQAVTVTNPYKGLEAFVEADADRFFGRDAIVERLWERCREFLVQSAGVPPLRLLPVIGPSGCGKSSVVRAGLLPELARRPLPGLGSSRVAVFVPGSHPIDALSAVLARIATGEQLPVEKQREIIDALLVRDADDGYHGLRRVVRFLTGEGRSLVIVVDQFEEVWSLCGSPDERAALIGNLLDVAKDRDARVSVILTLRSDFLTATSAYPALSDSISRRAFLVPSMTDAELRSAIVEPARRAGFVFDDATIDLMVAETKGREGALPLLEFALTRIWEGLRANVPAADTLRQLGGVGGALAKEVERIYQQLPDSDQNIVRRAFLAQVRLGEGGSDSRRRASIEEIVAKGEDPEHVLKLLRNFSQSGQRFITLGTDPRRGDITVEPSHEALLENWGTLRGWIDESREDVRFGRQLQDAVEEWRGAREPNGLLWRSPRLDLLRAFCRRKASDMTPLQIKFFEKSERQERRERWQRYGSAAAIFGVVLVTAAVLLRQNFLNWERERPWARLVRLSDGHNYTLVHQTANVGRDTEGVKAVKHQVALPEQRISRIHLGISDGGIVADWRSFYGTTVNAQWLPYGEEAQLKDDDILVLAGLEALRYKKIEWHSWDYLRSVEFEDEAPASGWAILVDGQRQAARAIQPQQAFVTIRDDIIGLSDKPSDDAVLIVRNRILEGQFGLIGHDIKSGILPDESRARTQYGSGVVDMEGTNCQIQGNLSVLTIQPLPLEKGHRLSSSIKEGDYDLRPIELPSGKETAIVADDKSLHGLGEIVFTSEIGNFQIVPVAADDIGDLINACPQE